MKAEDETLLFDLIQLGCIQFGNFTLKSGLSSPVYFNFRVIISQPRLMKKVAHRMWEDVKNKNLDLVCGVPYTALPIATILSVDCNIPMIIRRKEQKKHGLPVPLEGTYHNGQNCLVVEDLITSGSSILETIKPIENELLKVTDVVCLLDRCQGGRQRLEQAGYRVHAIFHLLDIIPKIVTKGVITKQQGDELLHFVMNHQIVLEQPTSN